MKNSFHLKIFVICSVFLLSSAAPFWQIYNPDPPDEAVKLVFIHHSTGENWLTDGYGDLGIELGNNNYFVSDTNYGWGPEAIGDRTDIPNWMEWFRSGQTPTYMDALFNESGQYSNYTRTLANPGGENQVIVFKSCFPNSDLAGSPDDPPGSYAELSVSGAKYVYNELLKYFITMPDKLFIVVTAPPLISSDNAENARAFNNWLVNDWLLENNYTHSNVAVFDFYNVLTGQDAHHRYNNGLIEHIVGNKNTAAYPSGDDHPSQEGSRKATEEFIPLLNIYYYRWKATAPQGPSGELPPPAGEPGEETAQPGSVNVGATGAVQGAPGVVIDDFEGGSPAGTNGWEAYRDEGTSTTMRCSAEAGKPHSGAQSLILDYAVAANSWATCALFYGGQQDWSSADGLTFYYHAGEAGKVVDFHVYTGTNEQHDSYVYSIETVPESVTGWVPVSLMWSDFHGVDWEANAGKPFTGQGALIGLALGLNTFPDTPNSGKFWVDDLYLASAQTVPDEPEAMAATPAAVSVVDEEAAPPIDQPAEQEELGGKVSLPCGGAAALPLVLAAVLQGFQVSRKRGIFER